MDKKDSYVYAHGYQGMTARVPVDKLKEWQEHQEALNSGKAKPDTEGAEKFLEYVRNL